MGGGKKKPQQRPPVRMEHLMLRGRRDTVLRWLAKRHVEQGVSDATYGEIRGALALDLDDDHNLLDALTQAASEGGEPGAELVVDRCQTLRYVPRHPDVRDKATLGAFLDAHVRRGVVGNAAHLLDSYRGVNEHLQELVREGRLWMLAPSPGSALRVLFPRRAPPPPMARLRGAAAKACLQVPLPMAEAACVATLQERVQADRAALSVQLEALGLAAFGAGDGAGDGEGDAVARRRGGGGGDARRRQRPQQAGALRTNAHLPQGML